jgi:NAD(P)-dependent dehydrogenase (short-subunit alcohol dehydrogenase family)
MRMNIDLSGKTALVTGSTAGIGYAIAKGLAASGATVIINGRKHEAIEAALVRLLEDDPDAAVRGVAADVASETGCTQLLEAEPSVDILVNNVGVFGPQDFFETPDEVWTRFFNVNVLAGVRLSRAYVPGMLKRDWGRVVFMASESGLNIPADMIHYGMTKTANIAVARGLAKRLAGTRVTVNSVLPGPTLSEGVEEMLAEEVRKTGRPIEEVANEFVRAHRPSSIIQRVATPDEVANLVVYVCSPLASATTGAALRVDGGTADTIA